MPGRILLVALVLICTSLLPTTSLSREVTLLPARCNVDRIDWREPTLLGLGFEPSIDFDSQGTIFVSGALEDEDNAVASPLWRSTDDGVSFQEMRDNDVAQPGLEGDIAVDGKDRVFFVDTYVGDSSLRRFAPKGTEQDMERVAVPSGGIDDRPWIAAHGDGNLYYMANTIVTSGMRQHILRSTDGGETFEQPGHFVPGSGLGFIDADPNSQYVYVSTNHSYSRGPGEVNNVPETVEVSASPDHGVTWSQVTVADYDLPVDEERTSGGFSPIVAVSPKDGSVHLVWTDGSKKLRVAESRDRGKTWHVRDVTPFEGAIGYPWVDVAHDGTVAVTFVADPESTPDDGFAVYTMLLDSSKRSKKGCPPGVRAIGVVPGSASSSGTAQLDFFQLAFAPDGDLHLAFTAVEEVPTPAGVMWTRRVAHSQANLRNQRTSR